MQDGNPYVAPNNKGMAVVFKCYDSPDKCLDGINRTSSGNVLISPHTVAAEQEVARSDDALLSGLGTTENPILQSKSGTCPAIGCVSPTKVAMATFGEPMSQTKVAFCF
jgi:hypothetical protein